MDKFEASNHIISRFSGDITPMKLQKLLYYAYAWSIVAGDKLFDAEFKAWKFGPVEPEIYHEFKRYGKTPIMLESSINVESDLLNFVVDSYNVFSAFELSNTTHLEHPWKKHAPHTAKISEKSIIEFYSKEVFAKNFPIGSSDKYYPPKTSAHFSYSFDMGSDYVPEYKDLADFISSMKQVKMLSKSYFDSALKV